MSLLYCFKNFNLQNRVVVTRDKEECRYFVIDIETSVLWCCMMNTVYGKIKS